MSTYMTQAEASASSVCAAEFTSKSTFTFTSTLRRDTSCRTEPQQTINNSASYQYDNRDHQAPYHYSRRTSVHFTASRAHATSCERLAADEATHTPPTSACASEGTIETAHWASSMADGVASTTDLPKAEAEYSILKQRVDLDVDFASRSLRGSTEITVQPLVKDLKHIRLHCRQCRPTAIQAGGINARYSYEDPYKRLRMSGLDNTVHQHEMLKSKFESSVGPGMEAEMVVTLPPKLKIQELHTDQPMTAAQGNSTPRPGMNRQESDVIQGVETPTLQVAAAVTAQQLAVPQFSQIKLFIEFEVVSFRDGIHWIGFEEGDKRYPYCYTKAERRPGNSSCIWPCVDDATSRCSWEIAITCARTLGDAFRRPKKDKALPNGHAELTTDVPMVNGLTESKQPATNGSDPTEEYLIDLTPDDAALELAVICVGAQTDDVADTEDESRHTVTFGLLEPVTARHVGFAIGPFEHIDLSTDRTAADEEKLGQSAVKVDGYCLPGRAEELRTTCFPLVKAIDHLAVNYGGFAFPSYSVLFVDDSIHDAVAVAGLSICSARLLFPYEVIEPLETNTRILVRTVAEQWMGVNVIAKEPTDAWVIAGIAGYMADLYAAELFGHNAYRWQQKLAAETVYDVDVDRPSIHDLGNWLHLDSSIREFLDLKSAVVLFILDRRLLKSSGSSGIKRIINKIFLNAKTGSLVNGELSTNDFQRTCERLGHNKLEPFFRQWVTGAGVPIFHVTQKFNKKKLVVEMNIVQMQLDRKTKPELAPNNFMRELKEHVQEVYSGEVQPVFTGPMTIRIHEADGTPYEHIVEIKEANTKLEIPYNTKYKRLKRSRRQRERALNAEGGTNEEGQDSLLYCLGDILDTPEEVREWNLADWTAEDEAKMGQESYEWIRMDADFEWIGKIHLVLPLYMYVSQLQQDKDLVAQYESMRYLLGSNPHHISLTILVRTLMDRRYFHGIRTMAAEGLAICAKGDVHEIGAFHLKKAFEEMFCFPGENMAKPNDWSDRTNYIMQCAIPKAMAKLRNAEGKVPMEMRKFFVDKLKFNDNSSNEFSDHHYVATLLSCLADSLIASHKEPEAKVSYTFNFGGDEEPMDEDMNDLANPDAEFETEAINEIERYRRIDEWITTYHNVYSITALDCLQRLTRSGLVKDKTKEVLQYTRPGNADLVRLQAFKCLVGTRLTKKMSVMRHLLHSTVNDASPFFRDRLAKVFGEALGHIALGDKEEEKIIQAPPPPTDGLVLEQEASTEARHLEVVRKSTPDGALLALKLALGNEDVFKQALWYAATCPDITLAEVADFCDVAALLYEPEDSCTVSLKLPKSWRAEKVAKATVRFVPHGAFRHVPRKPLSLDDWQALQTLKLNYSGPLSEEVHRAVRAADDLVEEKRVKQQIAQMEQVKRQIAAQQAEIADSAPLAQRMQPAQQPPPTASIETPSELKTGLKISLGKRKQSVDLSARAESPKALKLARQHTPNGLVSTPQQIKRSPSVASQRRGSTPGSQRSASRKPVKSRLVKMKLNASGMARAEEIMSRPSQLETTKPLPLAQARHPSTEAPARSITPTLSQNIQHSPFLPNGLMQSPTSPNFFAASPQQDTSFNLGAFRSYGPAPTADIDTDATEALRENVEPLAAPPSNGMATTLTVESAPAPSLSNLPPLADAKEAMPPPPRPKLTLKLGNRKSMDASSPE